MHLRLRLGPYELAAMGFLLVAALSSYAGPTAAGVAQPNSYTSIWSIEPVPPVDLASVGLALLLCVWGVSALTGPARMSALDRSMLGLLVVVGLMHVLALARSEPGLLYQGVDFRSMMLLAGGYFVVSRMQISGPSFLVAVGCLAAIVLLHTAWLAVRYGLLGNTNFYTVTGRRALLVSEDALLVLLPAVVAWGVVVDGLRRWRFGAATVAIILAVLAAELLSLRRGAIIFLGLTLLLRSLWAPRRRLVRGAALAAVALVAGFALGPAQPLASDLSYAVRSALLLTPDASSEQRQTELRDFASNTKAVDDAALGRGLGAIWESSAPQVADPVAFGSAETAHVRIGWHIYGLDWLYKLGGLGGILILLILGQAGLLIRERLAFTEDRMTRSLIRSLALVTPVFSLFLFTNPRVALFAGICAGALSALMTPASRDGPRAKVAS